MDFDDVNLLVQLLRMTLIHAAAQYFVPVNTVKVVMNSAMLKLLKQPLPKKEKNKK